MNRDKILWLAVVVIAVLAATNLIPGALLGKNNAANIYSTVLQMLSLFLGFFLALRVAAMYQKELKYSFTFLAIFLLLYMISSPMVLWQKVPGLIGANGTMYVVLGLQIITYAALIASCVFTIKVIQAKKMNNYGWAILTVIALFAVFMLARGVIYLSGYISSNPINAISNMFIRLFDMAVVLMLVPVVVLYVQHMRAKEQESITFTMIMIGLVIAILSSYVAELITGLPSGDVAAKYFQTGSWLDVVNIFGYLLIAAGLYAHTKYNEWGFQAIEKALGNL